MSAAMRPSGETPVSVSRELGELLRLSWPIALSELGFTAMGLVDTAILGRVSAVDLAGSAIGRTVCFTAFMPAIGLTMGLEPLASQAVGAGEHDVAWESFLAALRACAVAWAPLMGAALVLLAFLERFGIEPEVARAARVCAFAQAPGYLFALVFIAAKTFLQAHSKTRAMLVGAAVTNAVNFALCNVLARGDAGLAAIGLPPMGVRGYGVLGAGIAFATSQLVLAVFMLRAAGEFRPTSPRAQRAPRVPLRRVFEVGGPVGLHLLAEGGVFGFATVVVGRFGADATSAHQVALGLASFSFMGALGVSGATAVRVGYAVGEKRSPRRAGLVGIAVAASYMLVCAAIFAFAREPLARAFTTDAEVVRLAARLLVVVAFFQLFDGVQAVTAGALRGAGDTRFPFVAGVTAYWAIGVPVGFGFAFVLGWGVFGVWIGLAIGLVCAAAILFARFARVSRGVPARV
jgi:MATE family multidrug resistance protein